MSSQIEFDDFSYCCRSDNFNIEETRLEKFGTDLLVIMKNKTIQNELNFFENEQDEFSSSDENNILTEAEYMNKVFKLQPLQINSVIMNSMRSYTEKKLINELLEIINLSDLSIPLNPISTDINCTHSSSTVDMYICKIVPSEKCLSKKLFIMIILIKKAFDIKELKKLTDQYFNFCSSSYLNKRNSEEFLSNNDDLLLKKLLIMVSTILEYLKKFKCEMQQYGENYNNFNNWPFFKKPNNFEIENDKNNMSLVDLVQEFNINLLYELIFFFNTSHSNKIMYRKKKFRHLSNKSKLVSKKLLNDSNCKYFKIQTKQQFQKKIFRKIRKDIRNRNQQRITIEFLFDSDNSEIFKREFEKFKREFNTNEENILRLLRTNKIPSKNKLKIFKNLPKIKNLYKKEKIFEIIFKSWIKEQRKFQNEFEKYQYAITNILKYDQLSDQNNQSLRVKNDINSLIFSTTKDYWTFQELILSFYYYLDEN